jgi:RNA polymerase sigma factor (TIGR02999 family)
LFPQERKFDLVFIFGLRAPCVSAKPGCGAALAGYNIGPSKPIYPAANIRAQPVKRQRTPISLTRVGIFFRGVGRGLRRQALFGRGIRGGFMESERQQVTQLLQQWGKGDKEAVDRLMPIVYDQLRKLALNCLRSERRDHTLRATALVNEAYLKLVDADVAFVDRVHFYAVSARILRRILVDYARSQNRQKRGGEFEKITLDDAIMVGPQADRGLVELDDAMQRLAVHDRRKSDLIELLFFGGLTYDEAAAALEISPATVHRELTLAKAWLHRELSRGAA